MPFSVPREPADWGVQFPPMVPPPEPPPGDEVDVGAGVDGAVVVGRLK